MISPLFSELPQELLLLLEVEPMRPGKNKHNSNVKVTRVRQGERTTL